MEGKPPHPMLHLLFGPDRDIKWLEQIFTILHTFYFANRTEKRSNVAVQYKLKLLSLLLNLLLFRLVEQEETFAQKLVENILSSNPKPLDFLINSNIQRESLFLIGGPLVLALWHVMITEIDQIPVFSLASSFKEEQKRLISASVKMINLRHHVEKYMNISKDAKLEVFMNIHSRRFPCTVFLLCELLTVDPPLITPESLQFMFLLGNYLEWEGTICHDLAFWEHAQTTNTNNAYLFWLNENNKLYVNNKDTMEQFVQEAQVFLTTKKTKLLSIRDAAPFFDVSMFLQNTTPSVAHYFEVMEIMKRAKV